MIDNLFPCDIGAFVTKLNVEGSALVYSTFLGGSAFRFDIIGRCQILSKTKEGWPVYLSGTRLGLSKVDCCLSPSARVKMRPRRE